MKIEIRWFEDLSHRLRIPHQIPVSNSIIHAVTKLQRVCRPSEKSLVTSGLFQLHLNIRVNLFNEVLGREGLNISPSQIISD
jgi:hypothetical protein